MSRQGALVILTLIVLFRISTGFIGLSSSYPWSDENDTYRCVNPLLTEEQRNVSWLTALKRLVYARPYDCVENPDTLQKNHQPHVLYHLAAKACSLILGPSVFAVRLPAALLGIGCLIATYRLGAMLYGRWVGLLAAAYLAFHPVHLCYSQEARGYIGVMFFLLGAAIGMWKSLRGFSFTMSLASAACFFCAILMHPLAGLSLPGFGLFLGCVAVGTLFRRRTPGNSTFCIRDILKAGAVLSAVGVIQAILIQTLFGGIVLSADVRGRPDNRPYIFAPGSWEEYVSVLTCAPGHSGFVMYCGILLFAAGTLLGSRREAFRVLFVFLPAVSPLVYYALTNPNFLPERYLTSCIPFFVILAARGMTVFSAHVVRLLRARVNVVPIVSLGFLVVMLAQCVGPYRYEYTFGNQRAVVPIARMTQTPPFQEDVFSFLPFEKYFWGHLRAYGADMDRFIQVSPAPREASATLIAAASSAISEGRGAWFVFAPTPLQQMVEKDLLGMGFEKLSLVGYPLFLYRPGFRGSPAERKASLLEVIDFVTRTERPGYGFYLAASRLLGEVGDSAGQQAAMESALAELEQRVRLDISRDRWVTEALILTLIDRKRFDEATDWFMRYCSHPPHDPNKFYALLAKPVDVWSPIFTHPRFDPSLYTTRFARAVRRDPDHDSDFKRYWALWVARKLHDLKYYDESLRLTELAREFSNRSNDDIEKLRDQIEKAKSPQKEHSP